MAFVSPGRLFLQSAGDVCAPEDIYRYVDFLRRESGLTAEPPIALHAIYERFGIPLPKRVALGARAGMVVNPARGIILINEHDSVMRQRFSEAHELVEFLFHELPAYRWDIQGRGHFSYNGKERLCDAGAAELLMPETTFSAYVEEWGCSFETGRRLAELFQVSLTAALVQMVKVAGGTWAVVLFRFKNKPADLKGMVSSEQAALLPSLAAGPPPKQLRIEKHLGGVYVPPHKSVPSHTYIYQAWETGRFTVGADRLDFGASFRGRIWSESQPFSRDGETWVLSVLCQVG